MKKVYILTLHSTDNPGSTLQAYALCRFLKEHGADARVIDYRPWYNNNNGHPLRRAVRSVIFARSRLRQCARIKRFLKAYIPLTERYSSYKQLARNYPQGDAYIVGSDQLWNTAHMCGYDPTFYLDFVKGEKKLAYGISLGTEPPAPETLDRISARKTEFDLMSFREEASARTVSQYCGINTFTVCDPTALMSPDVYRRLAVKPKRTGYAVVYLCGKSQLLDQIVETVRGRMKLRVIQLSGVKPLTDCDAYEKSLGPAEWLGMIEYAELVITGSFHATMLSMLLHKQFVNILPERNYSRIEQLTGQMGCGNRIIRTAEQIIEALEVPMDFKYIDENIARQREYSAGLLIKSVLGE